MKTWTEPLVLGLMAEDPSGDPRRAIEALCREPPHGGEAEAAADQGRAGGLRERGAVARSLVLASMSVIAFDVTDTRRQVAQR